MNVQLAIIAFEDGRYSEAVDRLGVWVCVTNDFHYSRETRFEPRLMIFTMVSYYETEYNTYTDPPCIA
jgi:hypothetical protein